MGYKYTKYSVYDPNPLLMENWSILSDAHPPISSPWETSFSFLVGIFSGFLFCGTTFKIAVNLKT